jgi:hypothetical protein
MSIETLDCKNKTWVIVVCCNDESGNSLYNVTETAIIQGDEDAAKKYLSSLIERDANMLQTDGFDYVATDVIERIDFVLYADIHTANHSSAKYYAFPKFEKIILGEK